MVKERLQKLIALSGLMSRRAAEKLILAEKVTINDKIVNKLGVCADMEKDRIKVNDRLLTLQKKVYLLFHKSKGIVTTCSDQFERKTVLDYFPNIKERIFPIGRLDYNTEGLLLLTNDGNLANKLIHPKYKIKKTYKVKIDSIPNRAQMEQLKAGIELDNYVIIPEQINMLITDEVKKMSELEISICEGKNRQVRRMLEKFGFRIRSLVRTKFAFLDLKGIRRGQYRRLQKKEIKKLFELVNKKLMEPLNS